MSQQTGNKFPASNNNNGSTGAAWVNPGNINSDDAANASVTTTAVSVQTQFLHGLGNVLLAEDGGPIPAGATIIRLTFEIEVNISVTDSLAANQATVTMNSLVTGIVKDTSTFTQADNTSSNQVRTWNTGGTEAVPQTLFTRGQLAVNSFGMQIRAGLPVGALNTLTCLVDSMRVNVEWIKYEQEGGASVVGEAASGPQVQVASVAARVIEGGAARGAPVAQFSHLGPVVDGEDTSSRALVDVPREGVVVEGERLPTAVGQHDARTSAALIEGELTEGDRLIQAQVAAAVVNGEALSGGFLEVVMLTGGPTTEGNEARGRALIEALELGTVVNGEYVQGAPRVEHVKAGTIVEGEVAIGDAAAFVFSFAGTTRDANGSPLGLCDVWLFTTADRQPVAVTTSDAAGAYSFALTSDPVEYFARAHLDAATRVFGTSDRNLTVDAVQFYP